VIQISLGVSPLGRSRRFAGALAATTLLAMFVGAPAFGAPVDTVPISEPVIDEQANVPIAETSVPLSTVAAAATTVPVGCPPPPSSQAVFVGMLTEKDSTTATYSMARLRSGSLAGYSSDVVGESGDVATGATTIVAVYYGRDIKFLNLGNEYLVGTATDLNTGRLYSRVSKATELFGGNQVADIAKSGIVCPVFSDPARTLHVDGGSIESGVLSTLAGSEGRIAVAVLVPGALVLLGLVTLVLLRRLISAAQPRR